MPKKASAKGSTKKRRVGRKPLDLPVKAVRAGDAASIKGGSKFDKTSAGL